MTYNDIKILVNANFQSQNSADTWLNPDGVFDDIKTEKYSNLSKSNRPAISQSFKFSRPKNDIESYLHWNGFQPIDLDINNSVIAPIVKQILEKMLFKYNWVHSIALSTSKNGLHIYTYTKPLNLPDDSLIAANMQHEYYMDAFEYKQMVIWKACCIAYDVLLKLGIDLDDAKYVHPVYNTQLTSKELIDTTSARISQLLIITADSNIIYNDNFEFDELILPEILAIYQNVDEKYKSIFTLRDAFNRIRNRHNVDIVDGVVQYGDNQEFDDSFKDSIEFIEADFETLYMSAKPMHYDNSKRYRMAYTLAYLFNLKEHNTDRYNNIELIFMKLCSGNPKYHREKRQWANVLKSAVDRNIAGNCPCIWSALTELRDVHNFDITVTVDREIVAAQIESNNTIDKLTEYILSGIDVNNILNLNFNYTLDLKENEYIGTYASKITSVLSNGATMLVAPPGLGKTEFIKSLSNDNRVMLVEPYTSIISSKIEHSDLGFDCFYGDKPLNLAHSLNACLTFDKFTKIDVDEVSMLFDYVAIDECHLLAMSSYRGTVPADVIDIVNKLNTKVILMTGTYVAEHLFVKLKNSIKVQRISDDRKKQMNFVACANSADKLTKIAMHICDALNNGRKVLFPTNRGNEYLERITASAKAFYGRSINAKYYKKDNQLADFVESINGDGTIGDVDVLFCSNYLSVGVDINDTTKFDVIYDEQFTAQEIEQFNCRLRKLNIESYYYLSKTDSSGMPKNITQYEELSLDLTADEALSFEDIKQLHLNGNSTDVALFDFFKYAFNAPYFIKDRLTGEVHVHNTCYRLHKFEEKWREWAIQLNIVSAYLQQYGYTCIVTQNALENDDNIELALSSAKIAASEYRQLRHNYVQQLLSLADDDIAFDFIMNCKFEDIIDSDKFSIVKYKGKLKLLIADTTIFNVWRRIFRTLSHYYERKTLFSIINNYCFDGDHYNVSASNRLIDALRVIKNTEEQNLVDSNVYIIDFIIQKIFNADTQNILTLNKENIALICNKIATTYITMSAAFATSLQFKLKIEQLAHRIFSALVIKVETNQYKLIELPPFDSVNALQHTKVLRVIMSLFGENIDIIEANIAKNDLATELASSIKTMMNANNEVNETSTDHVLITTKTVTSNSTSDALLSIARDISTEDYRFRRAIDMSTEDAQSIIPIDSDIDMTLDINDALDNALNSALDELL